MSCKISRGTASGPGPAAPPPLFVGARRSKEAPFAPNTPPALPAELMLPCLYDPPCDDMVGVVADVNAAAVA